MPRRALIGLILAVAGGASILAIAAARDERRLAFTLDVRPLMIAAVIRPGQEACQRRIDVEARFDTAELLYGTFHAPGPRLAVRVLDTARRTTLATGFLAAGYADNKPATARVAPAVRAPGPVDVCVRNLGGRRLALYGGPPSDAYPSYATVDGGHTNSDLRLLLLRRPRSALSLVPTIFRRAALFHPAWIGAWTFWALLAALLVALPALLCVALARAAKSS